jgi:hypothetical protein
MSQTLWILAVLLGFAILVQLLAYFYRSQQALRALHREINASTQTLIEYRRKTEWLESRLEDLIDATRLQSCGADSEPQRLERLINTIKHEAREYGYRPSLGDIDPVD